MSAQKSQEITYHHYGQNNVKRPKYSNRSSSCWLSHRHDSILEADYCNQLNLLKRAGEVKEYAIQVRLDLVVNGKKICAHYVDFLVTYPDGHQEFHETKGYDTRDWQIKRKLVEALFPETPYIVKREPKKCHPRFWKNRRTR
ncbi:MAG: hypothetical protein MOGMAGMI_01987 [Candidatus Omnitrophica bacterium]|nr:hypothetical protein [Candidatus Omnitrophota bacterium]